MELYIRIKDGRPFEHPILGNNFKLAFPNVDVNNLPPEFAKFERIPKPEIGVYQVYSGLTYQFDGPVVKDYHHIRDMSEEEKTTKQNTVKEEFARVVGFNSWIFNEDTCNFDPPISYPSDGKNYYWDENTVSWIEIQDS